MKKRTLILIIFILTTINLSSQTPIRINEPLQSFANGLNQVKGDSLMLKYLQMNHDWRIITGNENIKEAIIYKSGWGFVSSTTTLLQNAPFYVGVHFNWRNTEYEIAPKLNQGKTDSCILWLKKQSEPFDSAYFFPLYDSSFAYIDIYKAISLQNGVYLFGTLKYNYSNTSHPAIFKINMLTRSIKIRKFNCYSPVRSFTDATYDLVNHNFIVTSFAQIENPNPPFGAGICKIDTNLNLIPGSNQTLQSNYATHLIQPPNPYEYIVGIEEVDAQNFLVVGSALNPLQLPSSTPNPNPNYWDDLVVGQRSNVTLMENSTSYAYGKVDTSESASIDFFPFKRIDSNLFYVGMTSRFYNPIPEPWDTELALFGLNEQGQKHWAYYEPLNDYCYISDIIPDQKGGIWYVAQCFENLNTSTGEFESFIKVGYIDSVAYWPRIGAVGIETPVKKAEDIQIYPNPVEHEFTIKQYGFVQTLQLRIYNLQGALLQESQSQSHKSTIDVSQLKSGLYLLHVLNEKGQLIKEQKLVKP